MEHTKAQNDPWVPSLNKGIKEPPVDPRHQLIDSARYIDSLEKRLKRIEGKSKHEPSPKEIINSLSNFNQDQMQIFLNCGSTASASSCLADLASGSVTSSYLHRKLHPEKQALNEEELFELLKDDHLERFISEQEEELKLKEKELNLEKKKELNLEKEKNAKVEKSSKTEYAPPASSLPQLAEVNIQETDTKERTESAVEVTSYAVCGESDSKLEGYSKKETDNSDGTHSDHDSKSLEGER